MKRKISSVNQLNSRMVPMLWSFHCLIVRNPQYAAMRRNPFMRFVLLEAFLAEVTIFFLYNNRPQTKIWHCFYIIFVQYLQFNVKKSHNHYRFL